jgi:hypothetical protein
MLAPSAADLLAFALVNGSTATGRLRQGLGTLPDIADTPLPS